ncbi:alkene reductase [Acetobacter orientalis]|uniref:Alkene reductase n=1 Tax=Acetobacter orientalis TaxID=146474 RepID=A0A2Z5ZEJ4_9PROT|nr:alkene reductase [Acetobacter orientalis]
MRDIGQATAQFTEPQHPVLEQVIQDQRLPLAPEQFERGLHRTAGAAGQRGMTDAGHGIIPDTSGGLCAFLRTPKAGSMFTCRPDGWPAFVNRVDHVFIFFIRSRATGRPVAGKPDIPAATDTLPQHPARRYSQRADGRVLRAAHAGRFPDYRRHADRTPRTRLCLDAGHLLPRTDRRLETGHRCGTRKAAAHLRAVVACRPRVPPSIAARSRGADRPVRRRGNRCKRIHPHRAGHGKAGATRYATRAVHS